MSTPPTDLSAMSMTELFRLEAEAQIEALNSGIILLERNPADSAPLQSLMRAAHSLKGAARIVGLAAAVTVAHALEDCMVAAQQGELMLDRARVDVILSGVDLLQRIANTPDEKIDRWKDSEEISTFLGKLATASAPAIPPATAAPFGPVISETERQPAAPPSDRMLRVTANHLNRLLGLAGESLVEARWLEPFAASMLRLKRMQDEAGRSLEALRLALQERELDERLQSCLATVESRSAQCRELFAARLAELETFNHRSANLSHRLYDEALALRMRPFADRVASFPRMVRDLSRALGKEVRLAVLGEDTQVDRDILDALEAPLTHLLRNAIDHGIESPEQRVRAGKPREGRITLEARHSAGMLVVSVSDDGAGISIEALRNAVVARQLTTPETAARMSEAELLDFLFLPGFTLKERVTEISGRGVGLDVVQDTMKRMRGTFRTSSLPGNGTTVQLQLPLTLSVLRALVMEIGGEPYGLPLATITRTVKLPAAAIGSTEGRQHFNFEGDRVGLVSSHALFGRPESTHTGDELCVVIIGDRANRYGLVVDRFMGERELVVQPLDRRLGKVKDVSAAALTDDGSPLLILDIADLSRSVERLCASGSVNVLQRSAAPDSRSQRKRVLVVDDSLTVRELERKLLEAKGYQVEIAVDGMDGWTAARSGHHDLIITDVDMPRMDGIELVSLIRKDPSLKAKPVMIVSYKDREEDRTRGLDAGADFYLTKGSFHDETLISSVVELIGPP